MCASVCAAFPTIHVFCCMKWMHLILLMFRCWLGLDGGGETLTKTEITTRNNCLYVGIIKSCNGNDFYLMACNGGTSCKNDPFQF